MINISESLRTDLKFAFETNNSFYDRTTGEWISGIDPENMDELKAILKVVDGTFGLNKLAYAILRGTL